MHRTPSRAVLALLMFVAGLSCVAVLARAGTARAQTLPPRPTPRPTAAPHSDRGHSGSSATGRITGTVIETTSGAPAPGIAVKVGDATVVTDANGNYDRNGLAAGNYDVALVLGAEQGTPSQGPITIALGEGQTVVQHLAFSRPPAATAAPTAAPTATPVVPSRLPATGGTDGDLALWALLAAVAVLLGAGAMRASYRAR